MTRECFICRRKYVVGGALSLHKVPKDFQTKKKWLNFMGIDIHGTCDLTVYTYICANHFSPEDFYITPFGKRCLKKGAVPQGDTTAIVKELEPRHSRQRPVNNITNESEKENVKTDEYSKKLDLCSNFSENSINNSKLVENLYELPTVEIYVKSDNEEDDLIVPEHVEEHIIEIPDGNEISPAVEHCTNSENEDEVKVPTENPLEEEVEYLSDSSTLTASENGLEQENLSDGEETASVPSPVPIIPETPLPREEDLTKRKGLRYFGDCSIDDLYNPNRAQRSWQITKRTISQQKAKIRRIQVQNRRLRSRIENLNSLLTYIFKNYEFQKRG